MRDSQYNEMVFTISPQAFLSPAEFFPSGPGTFPNLLEKFS